MISFTVPGEPVPWARARRAGRRYFTDEAVARQKRAVAGAARLAMNGADPADLGTPLVVECVFTFTGDVTEPHARRPDLDNLVKLILDAMDGVVYRDDGCVCRIDAHKVKSKDREPRTQVIVRNP